MKKFIKNLSDGGLAEDTYAFMERALDENANKETMVNKQEFIEKARKWLQENLSEGFDPDNYPMVRCYDIDMEDFIKEFSREMEE